MDFDAIIKRERHRKESQFWTAFLFMAPAVILVTVFLLLPVVFNIWASFTQWAKFSGLDQFAGLANYTRLLSNPKFNEAATNTAIWILASIFLPAAFAFLLAMLVRGLPGEETMKTIFFLPRMFSATAIGVIWYYFYASEGVLNNLLELVGLEMLQSRWLTESYLATPAMIVTFLWQQVGLMMVLILLGLDALPREPIDAARVDGASRWQVFRFIIWPMMLPTVIVVVTLSLLAGFTTFDLVWVMGRDYPIRSALTLAVNQYHESFRAGYWAYGSAIAVLLATIAISASWALAALQQRVDRRESR